MLREAGLVRKRRQARSRFYSLDPSPLPILEFVENQRLKLDWPDWRGDESVTGQTITFDLESVGEQTRLTFVHAGFTRTTDISDFPFGWAWFIGALRDATTAQHSTPSP